MSAGDFRPTLLDRAITRVSPERGLRRMSARLKVESLGRFFGGGGSYQGAKSDRRSMRNWGPLSRSADSDAVADLPTLRARSLDLYRNDPLATGAINTKVTSIVGSGLMLQAQLDRTTLGLGDDEASEWERKAERIFSLAASQIDITRRQQFGALQALVWRSKLLSGDVLVVRRFTQRPGDLLGLKVQIIEAGRVRTPLGRETDPRIVDGVEMDADGAPVNYWVSNRHVGERLMGLGAAEAFASVPAFGERSGERMALHIMRRDRPELTRGVPDLAPVIETLKQLSRYTEAEIAAAVISSYFTVFVKSQGGEGIANQGTTTAPVGTDTPEAAARDLNLSPAMVLDLDPGEDITVANPGRPNSDFDPFVQAVLRQVGVALELPFELLVKHFTASYSAARGALLEAWRYFMPQRVDLAQEFCQPVYEWVVAEAILRGLLIAPGFFEDPLIRQAWLKSTWTGRPQGHIDPKREAEAQGIWLDMGVTNRTAITAESFGRDFETVVERRAKEDAFLRAKGVSLGAQATEPAVPELPAPDAVTET